MRPQNLSPLFSWEERRPLFHEGMLCVPRFYSDHDQFDLSIREIFGNDNPIAVEFCSGNGEWIANAAQTYPEYNWIAVEWQFKRTRQIWSKKQNLRLKNLLPVCGMAEDFCEHYLKGEKIAKVYVNFPDPWPKNSHAKKRIIQSPFIEQLAAVCGDGAELTLVTDDENYSLQMKKVLSKHEDWALIENRVWHEEYGLSYFCRLWQSLGRTIRYMRYQYDQNRCKT